MAAILANAEATCAAVRLVEAVSVKPPTVVVEFEARALKDTVSTTAFR